MNDPIEQDVAQRLGRPSEERLTALERLAIRVALAEQKTSFSAAGEALGVSTSQMSFVLSGQRGITASQRNVLFSLVSPAFNTALAESSSRSHPSSFDPRPGQHEAAPVIDLMHEAPAVQTRVQVDWLALGAGTRLSYRELRDAERRVSDALARGDDRLDPSGSDRLRVRRQSAAFVAGLRQKDRQFHYCATFEVFDDRDGTLVAYVSTRPHGAICKSHSKCPACLGTYWRCDACLDAIAASCSKCALRMHEDGIRIDWTGKGLRHSDAHLVAGWSQRSFAMLGLRRLHELHVAIDVNAPTDAIFVHEVPGSHDVPASRRKKAHPNMNAPSGTTLGARSGFKQVSVYCRRANAEVREDIVGRLRIQKEMELLGWSHMTRVEFRYRPRHVAVSAPEISHALGYLPKVFASVRILDVRSLHSCSPAAAYLLSLAIKHGVRSAMPSKQPLRRRSRMLKTWVGISDKTAHEIRLDEHVFTMLRDAGLDEANAYRRTREAHDVVRRLLEDAPHALGVEPARLLWANQGVVRSRILELTGYLPRVPMIA